MADRPLFIRLSMPSGLEDALEGLAREVLRAQPKDMLEFSAQYFEGLLRTRNKGMYPEGIGESWAVRLNNYLVWVLFWTKSNLPVSCLWNIGPLKVLIITKLSLKWPSWTRITDVWWQFSKLFTANIIFGICVRPENQSFCWKNNQIHFPMDKGYTVPK